MTIGAKIAPVHITSKHRYSCRQVGCVVVVLSAIVALFCRPTLLNAHRVATEEKFNVFAYRSLDDDIAKTSVVKATTSEASAKKSTTYATAGAYRPLQVRWKHLSSYRKQYERTTIDAAWTEASLIQGDSMCVHGDGYAGYDYPEGPPSFFMNIKNQRQDRLIHFNPRRGQDIIVVNHCLSKKWAKETRARFPAAWRKETEGFQLCILLSKDVWQFELNGIQMQELRTYPRKDSVRRQGANVPLNVTMEIAHVLHPKFFFKERT